MTLEKIQIFCKQKENYMVRSSELQEKYKEKYESKNMDKCE